MRRKILVIGRSDSIFITRLLQAINALGQNCLEIDVFDNHHFQEDVTHTEIPYTVYGVKMPKWCKALLRIPVLRIFIRIIFERRTLERLLGRERYVSLNVQELPFYSLMYVRCAHSHGIKSILTPIGSDALRVKGRAERLLRRGFDQTDYVTITAHSGFAAKVVDKFKIDNDKVIDLSYGSDAISEISRMKGHYSREELARMLDIPYSDYYICCGYNAHMAQNHIEMLQAIAANAAFLPKDCIILFPLGYGPGKQVRAQLEQANQEYGLHIVYMMDYLSPSKVAALRLITDLFIHIQITDAHCFTMREFLLADTKVINGRWLSYPELEQYGMPYYECADKNSLQNVLESFFKRELPVIECPNELKKMIQQSSWESVAKRWADFYSVID